MELHTMMFDESKLHERYKIEDVDDWNLCYLLRLLSGPIIAEFFYQDSTSAARRAKRNCYRLTET